MQREGSTQERKAQNICLFSQITENLVVLYSDLVELTRYIVRFPLTLRWLPLKYGRKDKSMCTNRDTCTHCRYLLVTGHPVDNIVSIEP